MDELEAIRTRFLRIRPLLDERATRLWAANESLALGYGGLTLVARATGLARSTLVDGRRELRAAAADPVPAAGTPPGRGRVRRHGGGRKRLTERCPEVITALE